MSSVAWATAASELGIRVVAPHVVRDRFGEPIEFVAHVLDFGMAGGTLVWYMPEPLPTARLPFAVFFISTLNPDLYFDYDRTRFIDLLTAWGWAGPGAPPPWYEER